MTGVRGHFYATDPARYLLTVGRSASTTRRTRGSRRSSSRVTDSGIRQFGYSSTVPGRLGCRSSPTTRPGPRPVARSTAAAPRRGRPPAAGRPEPSPDAAARRASETSERRAARPARRTSRSQGRRPRVPDLGRGVRIDSEQSEHPAHHAGVDVDPPALPVPVPGGDAVRSGKLVQRGVHTRHRDASATAWRTRTDRQSAGCHRARTPRRLYGGEACSPSRKQPHRPSTH